MLHIKVLQAVDIYALSLIILVVIGFKSWNAPKEKMTQTRLFSALIVLTALTSILDAVTVVLDGVPGKPVRLILQLAVAIGYCLQMSVCVMWARYVRAIVYPDPKRSGWKIYLENAIIIVVSVVAISSFWNGLLFSVDQNNIYHRGPLFPAAALLTFSFLFVGYADVMRNRTYVDRHTLFALLCFALPPAIGGFVQGLFYGVCLLWPSMSLSLLIVYIGIQNDQLMIDELTGINNRRSFDRTLSRRISTARNGNRFGVMLIDIDNFRSVNDRFGHGEADDMLRTFARILDYHFKDTGFVARYGGDEFAVIVNLDRYDELDAVRNSVHSRLEEWNQKNKRKWHLSASIGCAPYIPSDGLTADELLVQVDKLLCFTRIIPGERRFRAGRGL